MKTSPHFSAETLRIDPEETVAHLETAIRDIVARQLRRKGAVLGLSGGIDSSVTAALCVRALGPDRVIGLFMPEADTSPESLRLGKLVADSLGVRTFMEDITGMLDAAGCYRRRDEAIRMVLPEYGEGYRCKIVLPDLVDNDGYSIFFLVAQSPAGTEKRARLTVEAYRGIVAATNCKQRTRKLIEYYYADRFQMAVAGTPNLLEYDQGFFVKNGDGSADVKPIAHLYKCQVYALGHYLGVPAEILSRPPTTDTYSMPQGQDEFFFAVPVEQLDVSIAPRLVDLRYTLMRGRSSEQGTKLAA